MSGCEGAEAIQNAAPERQIPIAPQFPNVDLLISSLWGLRFMNKRLWWTIPLMLVIVFSGCPAQADIVHVLSREYSIKGEANYWPFPEATNWSQEPRFESYQETSSSPLSRTIDWTHPPVPYSGYAYVKTAAGGGVTNDRARVRIFNYAVDSDGGETTAYAFAAASITFSPLVTTMVAVVNYGESGRDQPLSVQLLDVTSNLSLLPPSQGLPSTDPIRLSFERSHVYKMRLESSTWAGPGPAEASLRLHAVPEPSTLLLLASGLVGLGGMAWRRHRRG